MTLNRAYADYLWGIFAALLALVIWYTSALILDKAVTSEFDFFIEFLSTGISTSIGAGIGAYAAFQLNKYHKVSEIRKAEKQALNEELFRLGKQINTIKELKLITNQRLNNKKFPFNIPPKRVLFKDESSYSSLMLNFLLENDPQTLLTLEIEHQRFETACIAYKQRTELFEHEIVPKLFNNAGNYQNVLGAHLYALAVVYTNDMLKHINDTEKSLLAVYKRLRGIALERFPGEKFFTLK